MAINTIVVSGNVGKDCELRVTQNGKNIASFSVAVKQGYGEHERTSWLSCRMFGKMAEGLCDYIKKGNLVTVSGQYVSEEWEKDGVKRVQPTIIVSDIQLPPRTDGQQQPKQQNQQANNEQPQDFSDDIPF